MPDWNSPEELQKESLIFNKFMHTLLGLYLYEWFISLDFDWDFIRGTKRFRWPMVFYFANRYLLLFAMIGIAIALDSTTEINCQALYTFNSFAGDASVGLASINLSIRTVAVWSHNKYIIGALVVMILGHWSLILQSAQLTAVWVDGVGCNIVKTNNTILLAIFIYSMCFDLTVLILNAYKLLNMDSKSSKTQVATSRLAKMIFEDGLIFFIIAFLANTLATVFMAMCLNPLMCIIFNVPAAVFSTVVSCRAVRRLTNFTNQTPTIYAASGSTHSANVQFRSGAGNQKGHQTLSAMRNKRTSGVHVQMETFTRAEIDGADMDTVFDRKDLKGMRTMAAVDLDVEAKGGAY